MIDGYLSFRYNLTETLHIALICHSAYIKLMESFKMI